MDDLQCGTNLSNLSSLSKCPVAFEHSVLELKKKILASALLFSLPPFGCDRDARAWPKPHFLLHTSVLCTTDRLLATDVKFDAS